MVYQGLEGSSHSSLPISDGLCKQVFPLAIILPHKYNCSSLFKYNKKIVLQWSFRGPHATAVDKNDALWIKELLQNVVDGRNIVILSLWFWCKYLLNKMPFNTILPANISGWIFPRTFFVWFFIKDLPSVQLPLLWVIKMSHIIMLSVKHSKAEQSQYFQLSKWACIYGEKMLRNVCTWSVPALCFKIIQKIIVIQRMHPTWTHLASPRTHHHTLNSCIEK